MNDFTLSRRAAGPANRMKPFEFTVQIAFPGFQEKLKLVPRAFQLSRSGPDTEPQTSRTRISVVGIP